MTCAENEISAKAPGRPPKGKPGEADLREKIMDAAVELFSRKGVASATLKEISRAAGATSAVIYYHFGSGQNLVSETLGTRFLPLIAGVWAAVDESDDPLEIIGEMQNRLIRTALEVSWFLPLWSREFAGADGSLREYTARRLPEGVLDRFVKKIRRGQREGKINPDLSPEMVYMSVIGETLIPLRAMSSWALLFKGGVKTERVVRHVRAMLTGGLRPAAGPESAGFEPQPLLFKEKP